MAVTRRPVRRKDADDEPEEDERPARRSRARDEDEEDERPARRRRPARDEEDDEDERPARRRRPRDDDEDDEDEKPRRRRARDEEEEDDEDDEAPAKRSTGSVRKGWAGHKENRSKGSGDYAENLRISDDPELIKFLEDEPFVSFRQHWVDNPPNGIKKKSWVCLESGCPLCDLGDRPRLLTSFNILHLNTGGEPENKALELGVKAVGQLEAFAADPKTGPLTKHYWAVSKSGKGTSSSYNFQAVKVRDLEEDWDLQPLTEDDLDDALDNLYDDTIVQVPTRKQLKEIAGGLLDDEDDD